MKITRKQLRQLIKEELARLDENTTPQSWQDYLDEIEMIKQSVEYKEFQDEPSMKEFMSDVTLSVKDPSSIEAKRKALSRSKSLTHKYKGENPGAAQVAKLLRIYGEEK